MINDHCWDSKITAKHDFCIELKSSRIIIVRNDISNPLWYSNNQIIFSCVMVNLNYEYLFVLDFQIFHFRSTGTGRVRMFTNCMIYQFCGGITMQ